jgi:hypothetical protein
MAIRPLSDEEVYDLLHQAVLLLSNKVVRTEKAQAVLSTALTDLDVLQKALLIMTDPPQSEPEP